MKSKFKIKKLISLFLVFLLSINSFAAVVSDNDGSAFITKGEFDAIKNDFKSQIDTYNSSIDNKIDGAIAQYLSGVQIAKLEEQAVNPYVSYPLTFRYRSDFYNSDSTYNNKTCNEVFPTLDINFLFSFNGYQTYINRIFECTTPKDWFNVDSTTGVLNAIYKNAKYCSYDQFVGFWGHGGEMYYTSANNLAIILYMNYKYDTTGKLTDRMGGKGSFAIGTQYAHCKVNGDIVWNTKVKPTFNICGNQDARTNAYQGWTNSTWDNMISNTGYTGSCPFAWNPSSEPANVQSSCELETGTMDTSINIVYMNPSDYVYTCYDTEKYAYFNQYTNRSRKLTSTTNNRTYGSYSYNGYETQGPLIYLDTVFDPGYVAFTENALSGRGTYEYTGVKAQDIYLKATDASTKSTNTYHLSDAVYLFTVLNDLNEIDIGFTFASGRTKPLTLMVGTEAYIDTGAYDSYKFDLLSGGVTSKELIVDPTDTMKIVKIKTPVAKGTQIFFKVRSDEDVTINEAPLIQIVKA